MIIVLLDKRYFVKENGAWLMKKLGKGYLIFIVPFSPGDASMIKSIRISND